MTHRTRRGVPHPIEQLFVRRPPLDGTVMVLWIAPELGTNSDPTRSARVSAPAAWMRCTRTRNCSRNLSSRTPLGGPAAPARLCPTRFLICPRREDEARSRPPTVLPIRVLDRKLPSHSLTSAIKTLAESEGARSGPCEPRKATNFGFADPNNSNGG